MSLEMRLRDMNTGNLLSGSAGEPARLKRVVDQWIRDHHAHANETLRLIKRRALNVSAIYHDSTELFHHGLVSRLRTARRNGL